MGPRSFIGLGQFAFAALFLFLCPLLVRAASASNKIYVVNIQQIVAKSNAGAAIRKRVEKEAIKRKAKIERLTQEVESFEEKLRKQSSLLSKSARQEKEDALVQKQKDLTRLVQDEQEFLQRESGTAVTKLVQQIQDLLPQVVEKTGAAVIIEQDPSLVVYVSKEYDLTEEVIELLNKNSVNF
ncbi:MAG: OmpH family outer membrane protein [Bdellovibrionales bacterium]|nr:OmpH family outer membrane protein [Bdellovibrionales bacterium]